MTKCDKLKNQIQPTDVDDTGVDLRPAIAQAQLKFSLARKGGKKKPGSGGGFQSLGLSGGVLRGILRKGYKVPTPIQRRALPVVLAGKDVVAMARTGSGKTAAFVVPMLERLRTRSPVGARALVLAPTRELALQTHKVICELGRWTGLRSAAILGGDKVKFLFVFL